jgi:hypothetical protein
MLLLKLPNYLAHKCLNYLDICSILDIEKALYISRHCNIYIDILNEFIYDTTNFNKNLLLTIKSKNLLLYLLKKKIKIKSNIIKIYIPFDLHLSTFIVNYIKKIIIEYELIDDYIVKLFNNMSCDQLSNIEYIELRKCKNISDLTINTISLKCHNLKIIIIDNNYINLISNDSVKHTAIKCSSILYYNKIDITNIIQFTNYSHNLEWIDLNNTNLTDDILINIIHNCNNLKYFNLNDCINITDKSINCLLEKYNDVEILQLNNCYKISNKSILNIANKLKKIKCILLHINHRVCNNFNIINDEIILKFSENTLLEKINLNRNNNNITDYSICKLFTNCKNIISIDIANCDITDNSIIKMSENLKLKHISIQKCIYLTDKSIITLLINNKTSLYSVIFYGTNIITDCSISILLTCSIIKYIYLMACDRLTDNFTNNLTENNYLKFLYFNNINKNKITFSSLSIYRIVKTFHNLEILDISSYTYSTDLQLIINEINPRLLI